MVLKKKNCYIEDWDETDDEDIEGDNEKQDKTGKAAKKKKVASTKSKVTRNGKDHLKVTADFNNNVRMEFDVKMSNVPKSK